MLKRTGALSVGLDWIPQWFDPVVRNLCLLQQELHGCWVQSIWHVACWLQVLGCGQVVRRAIGSAVRGCQAAGRIGDGTGQWVVACVYMLLYYVCSLATVMCVTVLESRAYFCARVHDQYCCLFFDTGWSKSNTL